jgi:hypothetical protein
MSLTLLLHINNEDPIIVDADHLPGLSDTIVIGRNPRLRDGKDVRSLAPNVTTVIWPLSRMNFIEILPTDEEEKVISFVRE